MARLTLYLCVAFLAIAAAQAAGKVITLSPACSSQPGSCTAAIEEAGEQCRQSATPCRIELSPGTYKISSTPTLSGLSNFALDGGGKATLLLTGAAGAGLMYENYNMEVSNLIVDMERQPYTYGRVVSTTKTSFVLSVDATQYPFPGNRQYPWLDSVEAILQYDPTTQRPAEHAIDLYHLPPNQLACSFDAASSTLTVKGTGSLSGIAVGQYLIARHLVYYQNSFSVYASHNVLFSNITVYSGCGMGWYMMYVANIHLDNVAVRKAPGRPMSITADATHFNGCNGTIEISHSWFEGQGDDGMNVHGEFQDVEKFISGNQIVLGKDGVLATQLFAAQFDTVVFRHRETMQPYNFTTTVTSVSPAPSSSISSSQGGSPVLMATLADDVQALGVQQWDLMQSLSWMPSVYAHDNVYKDNRARGQLCKTHNVVLERNVYDHTTGPAVLVHTDGCYWFESGPVANWTVRNCSFIGPNYGPAATGGAVYVTTCVPTHPGTPTSPPSKTGAAPTAGQVHSGVTITGSDFTLDQGLPAVAVSNTAGVVIDDCRVTWPAGAPTPPHAFITPTSTDVTVANNVCVHQQGGEEEGVADEIVSC